MNSVRSAKLYYLAAFVFGALIALAIASPAWSAEPFRSDCGGALSLHVIRPNVGGGDVPK